MKIFISQPMKGFSEEEIRYNREKAIKKIKNLYGDDAEIIFALLRLEQKSKVLNYKKEGIKYEF